MIGEATGAVDGLGAKVAVSVLIVGEGAALFAGFCPSWFTVRSPFFHDQSARAGNVRAIRQGEVAAGAITILIGAGSAYLVRSPLPLIASIGISAVMVAGYEYSMSHPASDDVSASDAAPLDALRRAMAWRPAPLVGAE